MHDGDEEEGRIRSTEDTLHAVRKALEMQAREKGKGKGGGRGLADDEEERDDERSASQDRGAGNRATRRTVDGGDDEILPGEVGARDDAFILFRACYSLAYGKLSNPFNGLILSCILLVGVIIGIQTYYVDDKMPEWMNMIELILLGEWDLGEVIATTFTLLTTWAY